MAGIRSAFVVAPYCVALLCVAGSACAQRIAGPPRGVAPVVARSSRPCAALTGGTPVPPERLPPVAAPTPEGDLSARLQALEEEVRRLEAASASQPTPATTEWLLPPIERPTVGIAAEIQTDLLYFGQDAVNRETVGDIEDGSDFRRARIAALGDYYQTSYRIEFDFALPGRPQFLDVWGGWRDLPVLGTVRIGHFWEPFCLERLTDNRFRTFFEQGLPDHFSRHRNTGVCSYHVAEDESATWAIGAFNAQSDVWGNAIGDDRGRAVTTRVTWLPYYDEPSGGRYFTHVGAAYSFRTTTGDVAQFRARPEARFGDADPNVPYFVDTGVFAADSYQMLGLEFAWVRGPLSLQGEYIFVPVADAADSNPHFESFYCYVSYFLTGEHRPYCRSQGVFGRVVPFENFFAASDGRLVRRGSGAWEVAARISHMDLDDGNIQGGRLTDITLGLNWYLNPHTRIATNYIHAFLDNATFGNSDADIVGLRMQFDY